MEIKQNVALLCKAEVTYGVDPVPTATVNVLPYVRDSFSWSVNSTPRTRKLADGSLDMLPGYNTLQSVTAKFRYEMRGNRTTGSVADISSGLLANVLEIDPILQAANLLPVYTAESTGGARDGKVVYSPKVYTTTGPSVTLYWYTGVKLHKLLGGKADLNIVCDAGDMMYLDVTIQGLYVAPSDASFPTLSGFLYTKPPLFDSLNVTLNGAAIIFSHFEVSLGNKIVTRKSANAVGSIAGFIVSEFTPKGKINPESVIEATNPVWADWLASTVKTVSVINGNGGTGNNIKLALGCEYKSVNYAEVDDMRVHDINFDLVRSSLTATPGSQFALTFY